MAENTISKSLLETSIGKNGYTILKNKLTEQQLKMLKKELSVKPKACINYGMDSQEVAPIILYSENKEKFTFLDILDILNMDYQLNLKYKIVLK